MGSDWHSVFYTFVYRNRQLLIGSIPILRTMLKNEPQTRNLIEVKMCNTSVVILKGTAFLSLSRQIQVSNLPAPGQRSIA